MTFCSACGHRLPGPPPVTCEECGIRHYRNAKPCAGALISRDGQLLLMRRAHDPWRERWDIPGGFCEPDEHPSATAAREAREEVGVEVEITGFLGMWLDRYPDPADAARPTATLNAYYHARLRPGSEPRPADPAEASEVAWFSADDVPEAIAFPYHAVDVIRAWKEAVQAGRTVSPLPDLPGPPAVRG